MICARVGLTALVLSSLLVTDGPFPDVEPDPSGTELVELGPPPAREPDPSGTELVQLGPPPEKEPDPASKQLVHFRPAPRLEPPPSGRELVFLGPPPQREPPPSWARLVEPDELAPTDRGLAKLLHPSASGDGPFQPWRRHAGATGSFQGDYPCGPAASRGPAGNAFTVKGHLFSAAWIERTLHGIIANECQSKTYTDILALDGGTVGISHFATGSLRTLYRQMDVMHYFGEHAQRIPDRPYRHAWWREGMASFLSSREGRMAQQHAWRIYISPALGRAVEHGWSTDRELAIAASVANSLGAYGFQQLAARSSWMPERTLLSYARLSAHKERRRQRLNNKFPLGNEAVATATLR